MVLGEFAEDPRALLVETEIDHRFVVARVEARLRVDEIFTRHDGQFLQHIPGAAALIFPLAGLVDLEPERCTAFLGFRSGNRVVDFVERELGRLADQLLELAGILQTRELDQDAVLALANNSRFSGAQRVDTAIDGFDGRRDRALYALVDALLVSA